MLGVAYGDRLVYRLRSPASVVKVGSPVLLAILGLG